MASTTINKEEIVEEVLYNNYDIEPEDLPYDDGKQFEDRVLDSLYMVLMSKSVLVTGSVQRWDGTRIGGEIIEEEEQFCNLLKDCEFVKVEQTKEGVEITGTHHDGTNRLLLRVLTDAGEDRYDAADWNEDVSYNGRIYEELRFDENYSQPLVLNA